MFNFWAVPGMAFETTRSPDFGAPCACNLRRLACVWAISLVRTFTCCVWSSLENGSVVVVVTPNWPGMVETPPGTITTGGWMTVGDVNEVGEVKDDVGVVGSGAGASTSWILGSCAAAPPEGGYAESDTAAWVLDTPAWVPDVLDVVLDVLVVLDVPDVLAGVFEAFVVAERFGAAFGFVVVVACVAWCAWCTW